MWELNHATYYYIVQSGTIKRAVPYEESFFRAHKLDRIADICEMIILIVNLSLLK